MPFIAAAPRRRSQLGHAGGHTRLDIRGETPIAPSAIAHPVYETTFETIVPQKMTLARIQETTAAFVTAARRAQSSRFRLRRNSRRAWLFDLAIPRTIREPPQRRIWRQPGKSRALRSRCAARGGKGAAGFGGRLPSLGGGFFPGGLPFSEGRQIAIWAAAAGTDALRIGTVIISSRPSAQVVLPPMTYPDATFLDYAAEVKRRVGIPVIAVGRLGDPAMAERAVAQGKADFIALGRTLIADPQWL